MNPKLYQKLLRYFEGVNKIFHNGSLGFSFVNEGIRLVYYTQGHRHTISTTIAITTNKDSYYAVQDFCSDCFYEYERNKQPLSVSDISLLFGLSHGHARLVIHEIYKKVRKDGEEILTVSS